MLRPARLALFALLLLAVVVAVRWRFAHSTPSRFASAAAPASSAGAASRATSPDEIAFARQVLLERLAYAQAWEHPLPPAMEAFREWADRYRAASSLARAALEAEGVVLARARRPVMLEMIKTDPQHALAVTVPATVRAELPPVVLAELETRVAGKGDFMLLEGTPADDDTSTNLSSRRVAAINGIAYAAHPYGRREGQLTKEGSSLHGIALDGHLALHESPLRALERGEALTALPEDPHCPVSGSGVGALAAGATANQGAITIAVAFGRTWEFCTETDDMLERFEAQLVAGEAGSSPTVSPPGTPRVTAADALNTHTSGTQRVLVIRVDFSDFPGAAVTATDAQSTMDTAVKPFFEDASYNQTTLATTVTPTTYRLPQTGSAYALGGLDSQIHTDARALAAADYTLANFDRIVVVFPNIGSSRVTGSKVTFGGEGSVGGSSVWINGTFSLRILIHELGHTYGLKHANLWQVSDGNPVSPNGASLEYGDPFDAMGSSSSADARFHYNPWDKNRLGWLPDSSVTTALTSGTYRIYRYDHKDALTLKQPLALKIFRDGVRTYWVGLRGNFTTNSSLSNGAYVVWGTNSLQQTHLLDLTTPGSSSTDAALATGATFTDAAYGITIKVLARGGTDPAQYLDVQVTMPSTPPQIVTAWGREGVYFYDATGVTPNPAPETFVPSGLTNVLAIAGGDSHVLALKNDGTLTAWGDNTSGQTTLPAAATSDVAAIAAGGNVSGAVKRDGTVVMWGESNGGVTTPPAGLTGVKQLAIGGGHSVGIYHAIALKSDGTVVGWGDNTRTQATPPAGLNNVVAIAASDRLSVALKSDGTVVRWGTTFAGAIAFPTGLSGISAIASSGGAAHVLALRTDGTVTAWGVNTNNQSTIPAGLDNVIAIATGVFHSLALKADGTVVAWGSNGSGKCNVPFALPRNYSIVATSQASLALSGAPITISTQPVSQTISAGGNVTLSVAATGSTALSYQWRKNGVLIPGATASTFTLSNVNSSNAASYDVLITLAGGLAPIVSNAALLNVATGPVTDPPRLINLSILTPLAANETMTMGAALGGTGTSGTKALVARAAGPALGQLGVTGVLPDPTMTLNNTSASPALVVGTNNDWGGSTALSTAFAQVGAFPYGSATSKDAGMFQSALAVGNYTVQVRDAGGATGTVIAELYDATPASAFTAATPRLINVSVLKQIAAGSTLTAGFVVGGTGNLKVLVRAVGPTLGVAPFGISGVMANPKLELFNNTTGGKITENIGWGGSATLSSAFTSVGAFQLASTTTKDSVLLVTLASGQYSARVSGADGAGGTSIVEVYEVP